MLRSLLLVLLASVALANNARAQNPSSREGFWFNIGLGSGSLGCSDCTDRISGLSGGIALGGTVSKTLLIGVFSNGWSKSESGATLTAGTLVAGVRWYPSETNGFHFVGGLGLGSVDLQLSGFGSNRESGAGALLGLGYDIPLGSAASLTAFWNGAAVTFQDGDANFGQIGLGITIH